MTQSALTWGVGFNTGSIVGVRINSKKATNTTCNIASGSIIYEQH